MDTASDPSSPRPSSFLFEDLSDAPLGPGMLVVWNEEADTYIDLFSWSEHAVADEQPPPSTGDFRHRWLESQDFERDDSMSSYTHSRSPCPVCNSDGHALFARWGEGYSAPDYFDQRTKKKPSWTPPGAAPPSDATDDTPPQEEEDFDPPPEGEPRWVRVSSIAELKLLPRFIGVRNKKPLMYRPNNDSTQPLKASTFSHKGAEDAKCRGFEGGIDAEGFVRKGGICIDHVSVRKEWDAKERRFRQKTVTTSRYVSMGWTTYAGWETFLEGKSGAYGISYALRLPGRPRHCRGRRGLSQGW